jgi:hypothetical protein
LRWNQNPNCANHTIGPLQGQNYTLKIAQQAKTFFNEILGLVLVVALSKFSSINSSIICAMQNLNSSIGAKFIY